MPQRIGEECLPALGSNGRALPKIARRETGGADRLHQMAGLVEPAFSRATRTDSGSMSLASTPICSAFAAAIASTPVPVPRSRHAARLMRLQHMIEQQQAAARGAVVPVPNASAASISMASLLAAPARGHLAVHDEPSGRHGNEVFELACPVFLPPPVERDCLGATLSPPLERRIRGSMPDRAAR